MEGVLLDKFKDDHQKEFNLIKEESLSLEDKQKIAQNLVERYLRENGYQGEIPEVLLTDEAHSFSVDSKDKETGAKRKEKIYFSKNDIADPNLAFSRLFGHEKAHMNTYDEGKDGEETSLHTTRKIGSENKNKVFTEKEKADYLNNLRNKYKNQKSIEQQFAEAKLVPEKDKEHIAPALIVGGAALIYRYGPAVMDLIYKYGPVVYNFLSNPQNYEWAQVLIDNPELYASKDAIIRYIEEAKDKGEKLEEAREGQKQDEGSGSSQSPDPNKNKPDKDFNKVNLEETVKVGEKFEKLGTYVGNNHPELKVDWSTTSRHALQRMAERNVSKLDVEYYIANGKVLEQSGGRFAFITEKGMAVLSEKGVLITTYSSEYYDETMKEVVSKLFGK